MSDATKQPDDKLGETVTAELLWASHEHMNRVMARARMADELLAACKAIRDADTPERIDAAFKLVRAALARAGQAGEVTPHPGERRKERR
jgi:hypothetical protein